MRQAEQAGARGAVGGVDVELEQRGPPVYGRRPSASAVGALGSREVWDRAGAGASRGPLRRAYTIAIASP
jgi:hypothetical protein